MRKINKLGRRAAALVLAVGLTLSTAAPVLAADADEVQTPAAQTEQQETDTEADEADVDTETEADEAAALPELSEDREVAEEDEAAALPELSEDREAAGADEVMPAAWKPCDTWGHDWGDPYDQVPATCQHPSSYKHKCKRKKTCGKEETVYGNDQKSHEYLEYTVTQEATATQDGQKYAYCKYGCGTKDTQIIHYYGEWEVTKEATCYAKGEKKRTCLNCGYVETAEIKTIPHTWGKYVDDDKPGCQDQTESQYCTVCGARNADSEKKTSDPIRKHKFTRYEVTKSYELFGEQVITEMTAYCDYGCGEKDVVKTKDVSSGAEIAEIKGIDAAADSLAWAAAALAWAVFPACRSCSAILMGVSSLVGGRMTARWSCSSSCWRSAVARSRPVSMTSASKRVPDTRSICCSKGMLRVMASFQPAGRGAPSWR